MSVLDHFDLTGRTALVTGATRGLGQAIALALAEVGADIVGLSRSANSSDIRQQITAIGRKYHHIGLDLGAASNKVLEGVIEQVVTLTGRLDILVNNAGVIHRAPALEFSEAAWNETLQINLKTVFVLSQAAARYMAQHDGGKIINIASMLSYQGGVFVPAYTAAKHGVAGLTKAFANEWASKGINVNAIAPGYIETDATLALRNDAGRNSAILNRIPAGRWGIPDDLKGAVVFLASDAANYVHGTILDVDGGWLAR